MREAPQREKVFARNSTGLFLMLTLALSTLAAASLPDAWQHWKYFRPISLEPAAAHLVSLVVPLEVYERALSGLRDLRVVDDQGTEVPYVLYAREATSTAENRSARLLERSFTPGGFTQVVLDVGANPRFHNAVSIETPEQNFIDWVEIAVSDDARTWRVVKNRAPIFRFLTQRQEGNQRLEYSENNARYLRLRILNGQKQFPVRDAHVLYCVATEAELASVDVPLTTVPNAPSDRSVWRTNGVPRSLVISELRFEVQQPEFHRSVTILRKNEGDEDLSPECSGEIYRFRQGEKVVERLRVAIPNVFGARVWQVEVSNGNDPPLTGATPKLFTTPRHVVFWQQPGRRYELLYGQSEAKVPQYDLGRVLDRKSITAAAPAQLGPEEVNTSYSDPRPWTEQHGVVLWLALGIAVALLGYSSIRALQRPSSPA